MATISGYGTTLSNYKLHQDDKSSLDCELESLNVLISFPTKPYPVPFHLISKNEFYSVYFDHAFNTNLKIHWSEFLKIYQENGRDLERTEAALIRHFNQS